MGNIEFFDQLAQKKIFSNGRTFSLKTSVYEDTFLDIDRKLDFEKCDVVLDLGGGCGQITGFIAAKCSWVVLADGAENALRVAQQAMVKYRNITYAQLDATKFPLPFAENYFDKIVCYSVVHYLRDYGQFQNLVREMIRIVRPSGKILIGDIPLEDKKKRYLDERRKKKIKNFFYDVRYYLVKFITYALYKFRRLNTAQVKGLKFDKDLIQKYVENLDRIEFAFREQDHRLPLAVSREDLLIIKKQ